MNYYFPSCFTLNSAANRAGLIICVNKRDASLLSFILKSCPSALSPLSPCWLYLTVPPSRRQRWRSVSPVLLESHPSPTGWPRSQKEQIWDQGGDPSRLPFLPGTHFSAPGKGGREASLSGKCDLSTNCCSAVANVAIGAARLTINADLSASSTVRLWISAGGNEDASGGVFLALKSIDEPVCAH